MTTPFSSYPPLPGDPLTAPGASPWSRRIAHLLDTCLKIPGTSARIGLDPLIGLIPGIGDAISTFMGSVILLEAFRRRVPVKLLLRLGGNMLLNASVGAIPIAGDLFSAWFRSNTKNHVLLHAYLQGHPDPPSDPQSKWVLLGVVLFLLLLVALCVLAFQLLAWLWRLAA